MSGPRYPSLYQINTRVWLTALGQSLGRAATLDDIPDAALDRLQEMGFDWVWALSVWQTGARGRDVSRRNEEWRREYHATLPDLRDDDIAGSGFAITGYTASPTLGGEAALASFRARLREHGLRLLLDFVPNHSAIDHPWVERHPDYYVAGNEHDRATRPGDYCAVRTAQGQRLLAHGRDPNFPGWPDTLQLNYANPALQDAMARELLAIAGKCDGVRCDMAMLLLPEIFERTWGMKPDPFWPAAIGRVRGAHPGFVFLAEVYWDLEWELQQQGFDYTYDKRLYDRLHAAQARPVREHLYAGLDFQDRLARFLENHDEPRAATTFPAPLHRAAAVVTYLTPGLRFFHQGQLEGFRKRISPHLVRGPSEETDPELQSFYARLLQVLRRDEVRRGNWQLLECTAAWQDNNTRDGFLAWAWQLDGRLLLVAVNFAPRPGQSYVRLPFAALGGRTWRLTDLLGSAGYERQGDELRGRGLYLDVPAWQYHAFALEPVT